jgi:hypothetical protein
MWMGFRVNHIRVIHESTCVISIIEMRSDGWRSASFYAMPQACQQKQNLPPLTNINKYTTTIIKDV